MEGWGEHQDKNVRPEGTQESDKKADMVQLGKNSSRVELILTVIVGTFVQI